MGISHRLIARRGINKPVPPPAHSVAHEHDEERTFNTNTCRIFRSVALRTRVYAASRQSTSTALSTTITHGSGLWPYTKPTPKRVSLGTPPWHGIELSQETRPSSSFIPPDIELLRRTSVSCASGPDRADKSPVSDGDEDSFQLRTLPGLKRFIGSIVFLI